MPKPKVAFLIFIKWFYLNITFSLQHIFNNKNTNDYSSYGKQMSKAQITLK